MIIFLVFTFSISLGYADFAQDCLDAHNKYRKKHHVPPLELDDTVNAFSQSYANTLAAANKMSHSSSGYGENLYMSVGKSLSAEDAVKAWYDEIEDYNFEKPGFSFHTGHFTQLVWKASQKLGCAYAQNGNSYYVVANYEPPGNMGNAYEENVLESSVGKIFQNPLIIYLQSFLLITLQLFNFY